MGISDLTGTVRADGFSLDAVTEGRAAWLAAAVYDLGTPGAVGTSKFWLSVTSEGYNTSGVLGTLTRFVYGTDAMRKATPDDADLDESVAGSDLVTRCSLLNDIYNDDAGILLTAASGWGSSGGNNSNAAASVSITNESALDYPLSFGQWDFVAGQMHATMVKAAFRVAVNARAGWGIVAVKFVATGATSGHSVTEYVTTQTGTARTETGLYGWSFRSSPIDLSGFTQGETIQVVATFYPRVGDAASVFSTTGTTQTNEIAHINRLDVICDKNDALDVIRYVSASGDDTTGDGSSGNPWRTLAKAYLTAGVNVVRVMGTGNFDLGTSGTRRTTDEWVIIEPDTGANPTIRMTGTWSYRLQRLAFRGFKGASGVISKSTQQASLDGEHAGNLVWFDDCTFDDNGTGAAVVGFAYRSDGVFLTNCDGDLCASQWHLSTFSTDRNMYSFDGVRFGTDSDNPTSLAAFSRLVACISNKSIFSQKVAANPAPQAQLLIEFNRIMGIVASGSLGLSLGLEADMSNVSIYGNVLQKPSGTDAGLYLFADSGGHTATNFVVGHNTVVGADPEGSAAERANLFYNEVGSTALNHRHIFVVGNSWFPSVKSDTFGTPNAARIGNWPQLWGVNWRSNNSTVSPPLFPQEYPGLDFTTATPIFADFDADDFAPASGSPLLSRVSSTFWPHLIPGDMLGRSMATVAAAGAIQPLQSSGPSAARYMWWACGAQSYTVAGLPAELRNNGWVSFAENVMIPRFLAFNDDDEAKCMVHLPFGRNRLQFGDIPLDTLLLRREEGEFPLVYDLDAFKEAMDLFYAECGQYPAFYVGTIHGTEYDKWHRLSPAAFRARVRRSLEFMLAIPQAHRRLIFDTMGAFGASLSKQSPGMFDGRWPEREAPRRATREATIQSRLAVGIYKSAGISTRSRFGEVLEIARRELLCVGIGIEPRARLESGWENADDTVDWWTTSQLMGNSDNTEDGTGSGWCLSATRCNGTFGVLITDSQTDGQIATWLQGTDDGVLKAVAVGGLSDPGVTSSDMAGYVSA